MDTRHTGHHQRAVTGADIVAEARKLIGTPYKHQGRNEIGLDCIGLPLLIFARLDLIGERIWREDYSRRPNEELVQACDLNMDRAKRITAGTFLLLQWPRSKHPSHCAIATGPTDTGPRIIHAYGSAQRVVEHGYSGIWPRMLHSAWEIGGVTYE